jgi:hypothetical protein
MTSSLLLYAIFLQLFLLSTAEDYAGCEFVSNCFDAPHSDPKCFPVPVNDTTPQVYKWTTHPAMCPEYQDKPNCCNDFQNTMMYNQFSVLVSTFGSDNGGCDVCAANLVRFWCKYTCDPNQRKYVKVGVPSNVTNPQTGQPVFAVPLNFTITDDLACSVFSSCRKTNFISQLSQTQTSHGFFIFLGENSVTQSNNYIIMNFNNSGMDFQPHSCNATFPDGKDDFGYKVNKTCYCNNCQDACTALEAFQMPGLFGSVKWNVLIIVYVVLAAEVLVWFLLKRKRKTEKERAISEQEQNLIRRDSGVDNNSRIYDVGSDRESAH